MRKVLAALAAAFLSCSSSALAAPPTYNGNVVLPSIVNACIAAANSPGKLSAAGNCYFPEAFGAVGDGVANDTTAINTALTDCAATGGVVLLTKSYHTSSTLTLPSGGLSCSIVYPSRGPGNSNPGQGGLYPDAGVTYALTIANGAPFPSVIGVPISHPYQRTNATFTIPATCNGTNTVSVSILGQGYLFPTGGLVEINDEGGGHNMLGHITAGGTTTLTVACDSTTSAGATMATNADVFSQGKSIKVLASQAHLEHLVLFKSAGAIQLGDATHAITDTRITDVNSRAMTPSAKGVDWMNANGLVVYDLTLAGANAYSQSASCGICFESPTSGDDEDGQWHDSLIAGFYNDLDNETVSTSVPNQYFNEVQFDSAKHAALYICPGSGSTVGVWEFHDGIYGAENGSSADAIDFCGAGVINLIQFFGGNTAANGHAINFTNTNAGTTGIKFFGTQIPADDLSTNTYSNINIGANVGASSSGIVLEVSGASTIPFQTHPKYSLNLAAGVHNIYIHDSNLANSNSGWAHSDSLATLATNNVVLRHNSGLGGTQPAIDPVGTTALDSLSLANSLTLNSLSASSLLCLDGSKKAATGGCPTPWANVYLNGTLNASAKVLAFTCSAVGSPTTCTFPNSFAFSNTSYYCSALYLTNDSTNKVNATSKTTTSINVYISAGTGSIDLICYGT